jgi:hypothetical protein
LNTDGSLNNYVCAVTHGARPAFTLPSTLTVKVLGSKALAEFTDADLLAELLKRQAGK